MKIGAYNQLIINRETKIGLFLEDDAGNEVLLPNRYVPAQFQIGDEIKVFIYNDSEDRPIATTEIPLATANSFAYLKVVDESSNGAFMDMGLMKDLFVPKRNQLSPMRVGQHYLVWIYVDRLTDRLVATADLEKILTEDPSDLEPGQEVELIVWSNRDLGWRVIVDEEYVGMIYHNQLFVQLTEGQRIRGYVNRIREDGKLDILLQQPGVANIDNSAEQLLEALKKHDGFLNLNDNSSPNLIYTTLGMSKKSFKKGIGTLYKQRLIALENDGIRLLKNA